MSTKQKNKIMVCVGTSGISAGAQEVVEGFKAELKQKALDKYWEIIQTGDRGLFKDVLVDIIEAGKDRIVYEYIKPEDVSEIVQKHIVEGRPVKNLQAKEDYHNFFAQQMRIVLANCGEIDPENIDDYFKSNGYEALKKGLDLSAEAVVKEIKKSGLRGRGGAGFLSGLKWEFTKAAPGSQKYIICNADEGDPGAFMDRSILEGDPHSVIEGMLIAGYAVGASQGYVYCRAEYPLAIKRVKKAIEDAQKKGLLGKNILNSAFCFDLNIKEGAGAFVCGEETALIKSIEGSRGMPVSRPPYPAQEGLWGKPTLISNVETLANVRHILLKKAEWFASIGTEKSKGTKVFALAGKIKNTGLVEVPMGTSIRQIIYGPGGGMADKTCAFKGAQIGGPSGGCLPDQLLDTPVDYESINATGAIMGSGGMVIMDQRTCMVDVARFFLDFTVAESCGKCVPCRVGLKRMLEVLEDITEGKGKPEHIDFLREMCATIKSTALCGLGNTAPNPVLTTLSYFQQEYLTHIKNKNCPSRVCLKLLKFEVIETKCKKCGKCYPVCPAGAIFWQKNEYAKIDPKKCIQCKACINICPFMAIE